MTSAFGQCLSDVNIRKVLSKGNETASFHNSVRWMFSRCRGVFWRKQPHDPTSEGLQRGKGRVLLRKNVLAFAGKRPCFSEKLPGLSRRIGEKRRFSRECGCLCVWKRSRKLLFQSFGKMRILLVPRFGMPFNSVKKAKGCSFFLWENKVLFFKNFSLRFSGQALLSFETAHSQRSGCAFCQNVIPAFILSKSVFVRQSFPDGCLSGSGSPSIGRVCCHRWSRGGKANPAG